ncbi:MAG: cation-transporting P-type ATPase [Chloroflexi bacterium]|nr:cation-transporting P-type ATPase [Chloroflexota bacterium]
MLGIEGVYKAHSTRPEGLTTEEVHARQSQFGLNSIPEAPGPSLVLRFLKQLVHFFALLLWIGGFLAFVAGMPELGSAIIAVILINAVFSFFQEYRAERAVAALRRLLPAKAKVRRNGEVVEVLAESLVPGDVLLLSEGDQVSADARLVEAYDLQVDQSVLTGESRPAGKVINEHELDHLSTLEVHNLVFGGTLVASGVGEAVVYAIGRDTQFGQILHSSQTIQQLPSTLQQELQRLTRWIAAIAIALGTVFFLLSAFIAGLSPGTAFIFTLGMVVANVPEGLLPTVTLALAVGVQTMARRNAIVKHLSAVESMGSTTVICSDKTGTLTENQMSVSQLYIGGQTLQVTGAGYDPTGKVFADDLPVDFTWSDGLHRLLRCATLCNNARHLPPSEERPVWSVMGDPTEGALLVVASKGGLALEKELLEYPRVRELPFDPGRKRMASVRVEDGHQVAYVKGAPLEVLSVCKYEETQHGPAPLDEAGRQRVHDQNDTFATQGLRVLALAYRILPPDTGLTIRGVERELVFLGLAAMEDPPRPEVPEAISRCQKAGIRVIMITGDYTLTAEAIARRLDLVQGENVSTITGTELSQLSDRELESALGGEVIFARAAPGDKLRIVEALQRMGHVVTVTGDGVNDVPALKRGDVGVAMGLSGTDAAREAADIVVADDNFASIVGAIEEGRSVYHNIRKFFTYILASNIPEIVPFAIFALFRSPLALTVLQILAVDLGTDMAPALALGVERPEPGVMDRPPRRAAEHILDVPTLLRAYAFLGVLEAAFAMSGFFFVYWMGGWRPGEAMAGSGPLYQQATTLTFAAIVMGQVGNVFACRSPTESIRRLGFTSNPAVLLGIGAELGLLLALVYLPPLAAIFGTAPLGLQHWLVLAAFPPMLLSFDEARKALVR